MLTDEEIKELARSHFTVAAVVDEFEAVSCRLREIIEHSENDVARACAKFGLIHLGKALNASVNAHAEHLEL